MPSLPSNTFMFNYNARQYDSSTYTFPKTTGQLFDVDLTLNGEPYTYTDEYVGFNLNRTIYMGYQYNSNAQNPFNRASSANTFTFIYKTSGFTAGDRNLFCNRNTNYNYMIRGNSMHTAASNYLSLTPSSSPEICVIRVNSNGTSERKFVDSNGNTLQVTTGATINWGQLNNGIGFFAGYATGGEYFQNRFYWMYCSMETLTDAEVLQVIQYNENAEPTPPTPPTPADYPLPINKLYINGHRIN